jgi:hypothetical protein
MARPPSNVMLVLDIALNSELKSMFFNVVIRSRLRHIGLSRHLLTL